MAEEKEEMVLKRVEQHLPLTFTQACCIYKVHRHPGANLPCWTLGQLALPGCALLTLPGSCGPTNEMSQAGADSHSSVGSWQTVPHVQKISAPRDLRQEHQE